MSPQIIELVVFAGVAFFLINKLISILGTGDGEKNRQRTRYGENDSRILDVTSTGEVMEEELLLQNKRDKFEEEELQKIIQSDNTDNLINLLYQLEERINNFSPLKFLRSSITVREIIIDALREKNISTIEELVDKRYYTIIMNDIDYSSTKELSEEPKITDVTIFGNNVIVKVLFKLSAVSEEWSFSRNATHSKPNWYLSNIEIL